LTPNAPNKFMVGVAAYTVPCFPCVHAAAPIVETLVVLSIPIPFFFFWNWRKFCWFGDDLPKIKPTSIWIIFVGAVEATDVVQYLGLVLPVDPQRAV